jgi:hypothetical protein
MGAAFLRVREGRGRFFTGVLAPVKESGPHGIGVESLEARREP